MLAFMIGLQVVRMEDRMDLQYLRQLNPTGHLVDLSQYKKGAFISPNKAFVH